MSNFSFPNLAYQRKICLCELKHVTKSKWQISTLIESSNRSLFNSLSEKTTNDTTMKLSQCHFKSTFYPLPLANRRIYLQIIHVRRKSVFSSPEPKAHR